MVTIATVELPLSAYSFPNETEEVGGASLVIKAQKIPVILLHLQELRGNLGDLLGVEPVDVIVEQLEKFPGVFIRGFHIFFLHCNGSN